MSRIAIFGGSFNPPHVGHQTIMLWALATGQVDEVMVVPCFKHPFGKKLAPFKHRAEMCHLMCRRYFDDRTWVSTEEKRLGGVSHTVRTLEHFLGQEQPDEEYHLLIGADAYAERDRWRDFRRIESMVHIISPGRGNVEGDAPVLSGVSSTQVRYMLGKGKSIAGLVPASVRKYIMAERLYQG